jgi:hypothetical protein
MEPPGGRLVVGVIVGFFEGIDWMEVSEGADKTAYRIKKYLVFFTVPHVSIGSMFLMIIEYLGPIFSGVQSTFS